MGSSFTSLPRPALSPSNAAYSSNGNDDLAEQWRSAAGFPRSFGGVLPRCPIEELQTSAFCFYYSPVTSVAGGICVRGIGVVMIEWHVAVEMKYLSRMSSRSP